MITNLIIKSSELFNNVELNNLGKINVICGPNNSGKSSILKQLLDSKLSDHGEQINDDHVQKLFDGTRANCGWGRSNPEHTVLQDQEYVKSIKAVFSEKKYWYTSDVEVFKRKLEGLFRENRRLRQYRINEPSTSECFMKIVSGDYRPVLIQPKRQMQLIGSVNSDEKIDDFGEGLLNYLFLAKNKNLNTDEYRYFETMYEEFNKISDGFDFDIELGKGNALSLKFSPDGNKWLEADACGLGLQDLLVILHFAHNTDFNFVFIEEPESHMHPDMQRRLLVHLKNIKDCQFIITTHSNVYLNNAYIDNVYVTSCNYKQISLKNVTSRASMLADLGYSVADNLVSDLVILVEGPTDVPILEELLLKKGILDKYEIKIWPLGGDIMDQLDLDVFVESYKIIALLDKDPGSSKVRQRFKTKCDEKEIDVTILKRYSIESYFSLDVLRSVFKNQIDEHVTKLDHSKKLETQIGIDVKKNNRKLAKALSLEEIEGTDLNEFLDKVLELCNK